MNKKKKILLTGAAGTIGSKTLIELLKREDKYDVRIFERPFPKEKAYKKKIKKFEDLIKPFKDKIEIYWGDIREEEDVNKAVEGVDAVIHLAAVIPPLADEKPELAEEVNIGGTRNIINAMEKNGVKRLIYASSVSVYGDRLTNPIIKTTDKLEPSFGDYYAVTKIECEKMIQQSELDYTIFRLSAITIDNLDMGLDEMLAFALKMPLDTKIEWLTPQDCAYALVESIDKQELIRKAFNLGGGKKCRTTFREYLDNVTKILGLKRDILPEEAFATCNFHCGYFDDKESEELQNILHHQRSTIEDHYEALRKNINKITRGINKISYTLFRPIIRWYILKKAEKFDHKPEEATA
ncbi:MAG: NAD-dependent epimerase/dehydratase family protein [Candidatus Odinarchaeia archaeon]